MPEVTNLEVEFDKWCKTCVYKDLEEKYDPCDECLEYPSNEETTKPVNYKASE